MSRSEEMAIRLKDLSAYTKETGIKLCLSFDQAGKNLKAFQEAILAAGLDASLKAPTSEPGTQS